MIREIVVFRSSGGFWVGRISFKPSCKRCLLPTPCGDIGYNVRISEVRYLISLEMNVKSGNAWALRLNFEI